MAKPQEDSQSAATEALIAAGDAAQAEDVAALEAASAGAQRRLQPSRKSIVERMMFGDTPELSELYSGADRMLSHDHSAARSIVETSQELLAQGRAFSADKKISAQLRNAVATAGGYGFTVPTKFGGLEHNYSQLAWLEEALAANGLGALAVELSGQLTIGSSALLGYGTAQQRETFLPEIASGALIAFALTEVGVGVNAKRVQAYVERDDNAGCWRLNADGAASKLYITSATHGGLAAIVAKKGRESRDLGLFIVRLPDSDVDGEFSFSCASSNVSAFAQNINSRMSFRNFPVPFDQEIEGNGVEVLFYCLRMGRCMLAAMCAGFQRMMAADAVHYAINREGVGGKVIRHELPRLGIAKMLGGALTAQALAHLSLAQDADGADLAGLRDLTKSASAGFALESLIACERVIGGRSLDNDSRITELRPTIHAFGVVEGEDDLIRLGMVKDLTAEFTRNYLQSLLGVLRDANTGTDGKPVSESQRIEKLGFASLRKDSTRTRTAIAKLFTSKGLWTLVGWVFVSALADIAALPARLLPTFLLPRYRKLPGRLGHYLRFAEYGLRACRWRYLFLNGVYQLELTRAQLPMQRLARRIEQLFVTATVCAHASRCDESVQRIAEFQAERMKAEIGFALPFARFRSTQRIRMAVASITRDLESGKCSMIDSIAPQPYAHSWENRGKDHD